MEFIKFVNTTSHLIFKSYFSSFRKGAKSYFYLSKIYHSNLYKTPTRKMDPAETENKQKEEYMLDPEDQLMLQAEENKIKSLSKKGVTAHNFKMHKKLAQGIKVPLIFREN